VLKFGGKAKGDHATHFLGWIERPIAWSLVWKCSYAYDIIEGGTYDVNVICNGWK
jgi:hypothetical protein